MDDELKAIQADLDNVLNRLAEYMSGDKLTTDYAEPQPSDREDAARVALRYVGTDGDTLEDSIHYARFVRMGPTVYPSATRLGEPIPPGASSDLAELMEALGALEHWLSTRWPLEDNHLEALALAVGAWSNKECEFIGEDSGLTLTPKRQVDRRKLARESAAWDAFMIHMADPQANPIDEYLFERAGKPYERMSARTVSRTYYSEKTRLWREAFERLLNSKTDLGQSTRNALERCRLSRNDEN